MTKAIAITLYRRPDQTQNLFDSLSKAHGIEDYWVFITCDFKEEHEEACKEVDKLAMEFELSNTAMNVELYSGNGECKGVDLAKLFILPKAYKYSEYCVFLEDDTPIAQDGLRFFEAMYPYACQPDVVSISGYNRYLEAAEHERVLAHEKYHLDRGQQFTPWGWAMTRERYTQIIGIDGDKYKEATGEKANGLFDHNLCRWMSENQPAYSIFPVLPRTNHVGADRAEHTPSPEYLMQNEFSPFGAWSQDMPDYHGAWTPKWA